MCLLDRLNHGRVCKADITMKHNYWLVCVCRNCLWASETAQGTCTPGSWEKKKKLTFVTDIHSILNLSSHTSFKDTQKQPPTPKKKIRVQKPDILFSLKAKTVFTSILLARKWWQDNVALPPRPPSWKRVSNQCQQSLAFFFFLNKTRQISIQVGYERKFPLNYPHRCPGMLLWAGVGS